MIIITVMIMLIRFASRSSHSTVESIVGATTRSSSIPRAAAATPPPPPKKKKKGKKKKNRRSFDATAAGSWTTAEQAGGNGVGVGLGWGRGWGLGEMGDGVGVKHCWQQDGLGRGMSDCAESTWACRIAQRPTKMD